MAYQAELQSSRQKFVLYESAAPIRLEPGERHDFTVKHDIKEISTYTLICSSRYGSGEDAAYQPQYFKFNAANPLSGEEQPFDVTLQQVCHVATPFVSLALPKRLPLSGCKQLSSKWLLCRAGRHCDIGRPSGCSDLNFVCDCCSEDKDEDIG